ncbi:MAG TPA: biotin/lipoyl-binding protein, partial [Pirellulales bacterium]
MVPPPTPVHSRARRRALWAAIGLLSLVAIAIVARWGARRFTHSITKDAFIESHLINLAPQVSGTVVEVFVQEQDLVTKGQLLARIDPSTYHREVELDAARLAVAEAALAKAKVDLSLLTEEVPKRVTIAEKKLAVSRDTRNQADESRQMIGRDTDEAVRAAQQAVEAAKAAYVLGKEDFDRYEALFKEGSVSERRFQEATKVYRATEAEVRGAEAKLGQAEANRTQVAIADQALKAADHQIEEAVASVELAQLGDLEIEARRKEVEQRERA